MTGADVMMWRDEAGFVTPLSPVEKGSPDLLFSSRGSYEWLMHPDDALFHCAFGIVVDGTRLACRVVDCHPFMNAFTVLAKDSEVNTRFVGGERRHGG